MTATSNFYVSGAAAMTSNDDSWRTPRWLFDLLDGEFHFDLDCAATPENALCERYYTEKEDGLSQSWDGCSAFCNPPYGRDIGKWVEKAAKARGGWSYSSSRAEPRRNGLKDGYTRTRPQYGSSTAGCTSTTARRRRRFPRW